MAPKARIIEITNPFDPFFKDAKTTELSRSIKLRTWLKKRFPGFKKFDRPTIILLNGKPLMQKDWNRVIVRGDIVSIVRLAGAPVVALWVIAVAAVAGVVVALSMKQKVPVIGQTPEADAVYSLKGQRNQNRLGMPIEVPYGRVRMWPSYAAQPYNEYKQNDQWLYQLFCLGQGSYTIEGIFIEDTPAANFSDVEFEVCPPGVPVTLFPDNVVTSPEVGNIELFGANEDYDDGDEIEDSPGDGDGIPPTVHQGFFEAGPYVANPAGTLASKLQLDVSFPRGLYGSAVNGGLADATVTALFEARRIDDSGAPIGDWFTLSEYSKTLATNTPQRFTIEADVASGRYEVRASRTNNKLLDNRAADVFQWEAMRAFLPSVTNYGDVTMLAMKARATNNLNDQSSSRVNVVATRNLRTWSGSAWSSPTPTRSIVWAFCDIFQAAYGARIADQYLDLAALKALDDLYFERGEFFDWIFEQRITVWDAAKLAALVGRAVPMPNGSRFTMVRDGPQTIPTHIFNQEVIVKGSFRREIKLAELDEYDGLEVAYTDPATWKEETVLCVMDDEDGDNPERVTLSGCTSRTMAYRWGMWRRATARYRTEQVIFQTGLEGHIPSYGDLCGVVHDVPRWGQGGFVIAIAEDDQTLTLSEPVTFGSGTHKIQLRTKTGAASDVYTVTPGANSKQVVLAVPLDPADYIFEETREPPIFTFGHESLYNKPCVVTDLTPSGEDTVEFVASPYRSEPHSFDEAEPPDEGDTVGNVPTTPSLPGVTGLIVVKAANTPNEVVATWNASRGAKYYIVQLSYDLGTSWETLSSFVETTSYRFTVLPKVIWVRVYAVSTAAGSPAYWMGQAPLEETNIIVNEDLVPNPVTDVVLTAGFGIVWMNWADPSNVPAKKLRAIHIYITHGSAAGWDTIPLAPKFSIRPGQQFWGYNGLPDNERVNAWFVVETIFGQTSTVVGPHSATTVNGITLDHLIPGGIVPPQIVSTLPATGNFQGRLVFLTADQTIGPTTYKANKLYRWKGAGTYSSPVTGTSDWTAEVETVDLTGQITSGQIADAAVLNAKLADNAISQAKLQDTIISAVKLVDGAVESAKLASNAVTAAKIAASAVEAAAVAAGAITETKIASDAVTSAKIVAGAVTAAKIGAGEVTAGKIAANAVTATEIAAGAITAAKIGAGEVTAGKIAANAVTATEIAAGAVTAAKIGAGEVTAGKIAANAVTANEIAANAVTAAKIGAGEVTAGKIAANAVTATELAADSVTAGKIAAAAVTATAVGTNEIIAHTANIKDAVISTAKIGDAQITTAKIGDAQVSTAKIGDLQVSTLKIGDNAVTVTASAFTGGSITAGTNNINTFINIQTLSITTDGTSPVLVWAAYFQTASLSGVSARIKIQCDGADLVDSGAYGDYSGPHAANFQHTPGAGSHTYDLLVTGVNSRAAINRTLMALHVKK